ncbi:MAG TPA: biosynthetic peptidoglycan transglycosylase [Polyangiaceae bacterium]|nr:biosynthetic peptidoglycan transglycosylase [Polyangiaceae bacterium]
MRKRIWVPAGVVLALLVGAACGVRPWVRHLVREEAARRGVLLEVGRLELGWGSVALRDVDLRLEGVEGVEARLERVDARVGLSAPRLRQLSVDGGVVKLEGTVAELEQRLSQFRRRHPSQSSEAERDASAPARTESARGLDVLWRGAFGGEAVQKLSGVTAERSAERLRLGVELMSLTKDELDVSLVGAAAEWESRGNGRILRLLRASEATVRYRVPAVVPSAPANPDDPPQLPADEDDEPNSERGLLDRFVLHPERVVAARALLERLRELGASAPEVAELAALTLVVEKAPDRLQVGPQRLVVERSAEALRFTLSRGEVARGTPLSFSGSLPFDPTKESELRLEGGPVSLRALGVNEGDFGLHQLGESALSGSLRATLSGDAGTVRVEGQAAIESLELHNASLSPAPIELSRLVVSGRAEASLDGSHFALRSGELRLGEARLSTELDMERGAEFVTLDLRAKAPLVSCQALFDSAPRGLLGEVGSLGLAGTFSLDAAVQADTRKLGKMAVRWDLKNDCKIQRVPPTLSPDRFRSAFDKEVVGEGDVPQTLVFGPGSERWTPYADISRHLESALLVTEDGRFFRHKGFDDRAIESSIRDNTRAGKFVRGASTISMQLAKNLYLSRDKNLSRKLQEAALTMLLEQSFEKTSLLELYVNVVEFGPGVYGIRAAAEHYFHTTPAQLTAAQCFFIASILPAPTRDYFGSDGRLRPARKRHVDQLLAIARKRDRLTDEELTAAMAEELVFGRAATTPEAPEPAAAPDAARAVPEVAEPPSPEPPPPGPHSP